MRTGMRTGIGTAVATARLTALAAIVLLAGCNSATKISPTQKAVRAYNGTASVGDFLTISIDSTALTITYQNYTNGDTGTVPYTVNGDGTYTISDPNGNLLRTQGKLINDGRQFFVKVSYLFRY